MGSPNLANLLQTWVSSPTAGKLRPSEDGIETSSGFLGGEFSIDLLLAPSPPPPPDPPPVPVEDSAGSGTGGNASQTGGILPPAAVKLALGLELQHRSMPAQQTGLEPQQQQQQVQHVFITQLQHATSQPQQTALMQPTHNPAQHGMQGVYMPPAGSISLQPFPHQLAQGSVAANANGMQQFWASQGNLSVSLSGTEAPPSALPMLSSVPSESGQQQAEHSDTNADGKRRRGPRPRVFKKHTCQSDGCTVDLAPLSFYLQRNHICPDHLKADSYLVKGVPSRFCQRCGQGHPLTEFEGSKRSCRKALERHNQRRRDKQAASTGTGPSMAAEPAAATGAPAAGLKTEPTEPQLHLQMSQGAQANAAYAMARTWFDSSFPPMLPQPQQQHPLSTEGFQQHVQQQQQQQQQQQASMQAQPLQLPSMQQLPPQQPQQQQLRGGALLPIASASLLHQLHGGWVMLPRHLLEQHAPQLLSAAVPAAAPPTGGQQRQQPHGQQSHQHLQQHQQPHRQQQDHQQQQQQALSDASLSLPHLGLHPPQPHTFTAVDELPFSVWQGEFGGSGI